MRPAELFETLIMARHLGIGITRTCRASTEGVFTVAQLPAGTYEITAHRASLAAVRITDIAVSNDQTRHLELTMRPASISETIEVLASASSINPLGIPRRQNSHISDQYAGVPLPPQVAWKYLF